MKTIEQPVVSVVDGEATIRHSMQALIEGAGWFANTFASAAEFLTQPRPDAPSCLLIDAQLPVHLL